jgi:AraC-like DNA-binding protein
MRACVLFEDPHITVARYEHLPAVPHRDPKMETSEAHAISFVERGAFSVHRGKDTWRLTRGALFVTRPGMRYRCSHESAIPDDVCLSVRPSAHLVEEAASAAGRGWDSSVPAAPLTNRLAYLHGHLLAAMKGPAPPVTVPQLVKEILAEVLGPPTHKALCGGRQLAWYTERVDAARDLMERRYAEPLSIATLSREVGISPFHFSRIFRELTGVPPHRYLVGVRLHRAAEALRQGTRVTAAAQNSGFVNLGQFIRQFHRAHGVTPSRYRRASGVAQREERL